MSDVLPIAANISTLFRELPLLERFEAARSHGFDGVEIQAPYSEPPEALARAAGAAGMPVVLINVPVVAAEHPFGIAERTSRKRPNTPRPWGRASCMFWRDLRRPRQTARKVFAHTKTIWISPSIYCVPRESSP